MSQDMSRVSVILPAHNEAKTIRNTVIRYYDEIGGKLPVEFIVAEDGSEDGTKEILAALKQELPIMVLSDHERKGYARGVADALNSSNSEIVFFSDSDDQYQPSDFWTLWNLRERYDMVIGRKVRRREPAHRILLSKVFHRLINSLFGLNLHDADCGFRLIRKEVVRDVIENVRFLEYSFWAEFTIHSALKGYRLCEVPIGHSSRSNGQTHIYEPWKIPIIVLKQLRGLARFYMDLKVNSSIVKT